jgi:tetratricopeptide (TPR) repeat protein
MRRSLLLVLAVTTCMMAGQKESELDQYSDVAREALASKNWDAAARALEHVAQLAPQVPEVHANLGLAYYSEGRPEEALISFERARKLNPHLPQVAAMIGICKADLGQCTEAIGILSPAFQHPADESTGKLVGLHLLHCYSQLKQPTEALATGEKLLARFPNDPEILYQLSRLHAERSSELMGSLLRAAPDSAWMHYANAQVQESLDRLGAATQEYRHALERNPAMADVHYKLGRLILRQSRTPDALEKARHEFEQELGVSPANADAEYELGEIDREQNQYKAAISHFERAVQYHPDFFEARVAMAKVLLTMGQTAAALPYLQWAARLEPGNKVPHYLLGSAYKVLGNPDQAAKEFAVYRKLDVSNSSASLQSPESDR